VDVSDHIEIQCSVRYNGIWTPVFICAPHLPGTAISNTSSNHVLYKRVIAASDIEDSTQLNCSMTFTLVTDYEAISPDDMSTEPQKPVYHFVWKTCAIRVVSASGKYTEIDFHVIRFPNFIASRIQRSSSVLYISVLTIYKATTMYRPNFITD